MLDVANVEVDEGTRQAIPDATCQGTNSSGVVSKLELPLAIVTPSRNVQSGHCEGLTISPSNALVISVGHWEARAVKLPYYGTEFCGWFPRGELRSS